jgi:hypothetical protein
MMFKGSLIDFVHRANFDYIKIHSILVIVYVFSLRLGGYEEIPTLLGPTW